VVVRIVDWQQLRELRLQALADAPHAFGSTLERERAFSQDEWRLRCEGSVWAGAHLAGRPVGLACLGRGPDDEQQTCRRIFAMWVAPRARGGSAATALLHFILGWAAAEGARFVLLNVAEDNLLAHNLYLRHGFRPTGEWEALASNPSVRAVEMRFDLV
jgi:GNAT superfamily N-acetyltransferase